MSQSESRKIAQNTKRFFLGTFLSRCSGLIRDLAMAFAFGDHPSVAAFLIAFRLSNLFRRLLGEGPLQSAFIPHFEELRSENLERAHFFFRKLTALIALVLILLTLSGEAILFGLQSFFHFSPDNVEILTLTAWLLPGLVFICLYGLNISLLQCYESFFISSFAPFMCNLIWIAGALYLKNWEARLAMPELCKFIVVGFLAQWLITLPFTLKKTTHASGKWLFAVKGLISPEVRRLIKSFSLGAIGVGATQINAFLDALFARFADLKGPVYLWYSIRLEQLALAILGMACVNTLVPRLTRLIKSSDLSNAHPLFSYGYRRILLIMIPSTLALFTLGVHAIHLLYARDGFSTIGVVQTTYCLWAYALSLLPTTLIFLYSSILFARGEFRIATQISLFSVLFNILLSSLFVFVFEWGAISTALATSFSAWLNCALLRREVVKQQWHSDSSKMLIMHILGASLFASFMCLLLDYMLFNQSLKLLFLHSVDQYPQKITYQAFYLVGQFSFFIGAFFVYGWVFNIEQILVLFKEFRGQKRARLS